MCQPWAQVEFRIQGADDGIKNADGHFPFIAIDFLGSNNPVGVLIVIADDFPQFFQRCPGCSHDILVIFHDKNGRRIFLTGSDCLFHLRLDLGFRLLISRFQKFKNQRN